MCRDCHGGHVSFLQHPAFLPHTSQFQVSTQAVLVTLVPPSPSGLKALIKSFQVVSLDTPGSTFKQSCWLVLHIFLCAFLPTTLCDGLVTLYSHFLCNNQILAWGLLLPGKAIRLFYFTRSC